MRETAGTDSVLRTQPCTASIRGVRRSCDSRRPSQLISAILVVGNEPAAKAVHATVVAVRVKVSRSLYRYQSDKLNQCSAIIAVENGKLLYQEYEKYTATSTDALMTESSPKMVLSQSKPKQQTTRPWEHK